MTVSKYLAGMSILKHIRNHIKAKLTQEQIYTRTFVRELQKEIDLANQTWSHNFLNAVGTLHEDIDFKMSNDPVVIRILKE